MDVYKLWARNSGDATSTVKSDQSTSQFCYPLTGGWERIKLRLAAHGYAVVMISLGITLHLHGRYAHPEIN
jgi:hypothetical protein